MRRIAAVGLPGTAALAAWGCGSGEETASAVQEVTLTVGTPTEFTIKASQTSFRVGTRYHFTVTNKGRLAHEIMLMPVVASGDMTMSQMDEMALGMVEEEEFGPGATQGFDVTFGADDVGKGLELACHLAGHYESGMQLAINAPN